MMLRVPDRRLLPVWGLGGKKVCPSKKWLLLDPS